MIPPASRPLAQPEIPATSRRTESAWVGRRAKFFAGSDHKYPFQSISVRSVGQGPLPGGFAATLMQVMAAGVIVRVPATIGSEVPCHADANGGRQLYREAIDWRLTGGFAATLMQVIAAGVIVRVPATSGSEVRWHVDASGGRQLYRGAIDCR